MTFDLYRFMKFLLSPSFSSLEILLCQCEFSSWKTKKRNNFFSQCLTELKFTYPLLSTLMRWYRLFFIHLFYCFNYSDICSSLMEWHSLRKERIKWAQSDYNHGNHEMHQGDVKVRWMNPKTFHWYASTGVSRRTSLVNGEHQIVHLQKYCC